MIVVASQKVSRRHRPRRAQRWARAVAADRGEGVPVRPLGAHVAVPRRVPHRARAAVMVRRRHAPARRFRRVDVPARTGRRRRARRFAVVCIRTVFCASRRHRRRHRDAMGRDRLGAARDLSAGPRDAGLDRKPVADGVHRLRALGAGQNLDRGALRAHGARRPDHLRRDAYPDHRDRRIGLGHDRPAARSAHRGFEQPAARGLGATTGPTWPSFRSIRS